MTSLPQAGAFSDVRLAGRSTSLIEGWASVEISAFVAAFAFAVVTGQSLGFWGIGGGHTIGSAGLAQPLQWPHGAQKRSECGAVFTIELALYFDNTFPKSRRRRFLLLRKKARTYALVN